MAKRIRKQSVGLSRTFHAQTSRGGLKKVADIDENTQQKKNCLRPRKAVQVSEFVCVTSRRLLNVRKSQNVQRTSSLQIQNSNF